MVSAHFFPPICPSCFSNICQLKTYRCLGRAVGTGEALLNTVMMEIPNSYLICCLLMRQKKQEAWSTRGGGKQQTYKSRKVKKEADTDIEATAFSSLPFS